MKKIYKNLFLILVLSALIAGCAKEETRYIDPMIYGICDKTDGTITQINSGSWNTALIGFRDQRIKLLGIKSLVENDGYTGDNYTLSDPQLTAQRVDQTLQRVEMKLDSVWKASIQNAFTAVNKNSAGIQNFGLNTYNNTSTLVTNNFIWLMADVKDPNVLDLTANDFVDLQGKIEVLAGLAALNDAEVTAFVNEIKAKYAEMKQQYADLAPQIASSAYFSKGQKAIYAGLDQPLKDMQTTIEINLSLATKAQMDALDRDLSALVYFLANNNTSPAQKPIVYGEISSITELRWLSEVATADDLNGDWVLTADIDAAETARWNQDDPDGRFGFRPITTATSINFDGQFHIISGLHIIKIGGAEDENRSGMFAKIVNGSIRNLGLINIRMTKSPTAGGNQGGTLVGWISGPGGVTKCFTEGTFVGAGSQTGGFIGRPQSLTGEISDCFSVVDVTENANVFTSSFIGLPVAVVNMFNCYNLGFTDNKAIFGHGSGVTLNASGVFYDSQFVGSTELDRGAALYTAGTIVTLSDPGVTTDLPTADWGDLANFPGFSAATWEIRTETQFDANPRPYLKGFNYDAIKDFIVVP